MLHHGNAVRENFDFSGAFDVVDHPVLLAKLCKLDLPESIQN